MSWISYKKLQKELISLHQWGESGDIIFLIHGLGCPINHWHNQISFFSKTHIVFAIEEGKLLSSDIQNSNLLGKLIDCYNEEIINLKIKYPNKKIHLMGHSLGVPISLLVANKDQNLCDSLIFINGFITPPLAKLSEHFDLIKAIDYLLESNNIRFLKLLTISVWKLSIYNPLFQWISHLLGGFNLERTPFQDMEIYSKFLSNYNIYTFLNLLKNVLKLDLVNIASNTKIPTLLFIGGRDKVTPIQQQQLISQSLPNCKSLFYEEGSHTLQLDLPKVVNEQISSFISLESNKGLQTEV